MSGSETGPVGGDGSPARLRVGKLPVEHLAALLAELPTPGPEVLIGPAVGEDAAALEVPAGVLVAATDPITFTTEDLGRLAVIVNANDVAVMGVAPRWFLATVLLPPGTASAEVSSLFAAIGEALSELDAALVGGHTEVTPAVTQPVVVGQMLGLTEDRRIITSGGAEAGHAIVQVGPAPVEGAAVLARAAGARLAGVSAATLNAAREAIDVPGVSIVRPALLAARLGATAMHDPTEGGLAAGLHELATASGVRCVIDRKSVLWFPPGVAVCQAVGADPWSTIASGTLLAAFPGHDAADAVRHLRSAAFDAAIIGSCAPGVGVEDRAGTALPCSERDEVARLFE